MTAAPAKAASSFNGVVIIGMLIGSRDGLINMEEFQKTILGFFRDEDSLNYFARLYHDLCEAYDQKICSYKDNRGIAMPTTSLESVLINNHAIKVRQELWFQVDALGYTPKQWQEAITRTA